MKQLFLTVAMAMLGYGAYAQWLGTSPVYYTGGNVGIGTTTPSSSFDMTTEGKGIFTRNSANDAGIFMTAQNGGYGIVQAVNYANSATNNLSLQPFGGNVGIGTASPSYPLEVNGIAKVSNLYFPTAGGVVGTSDNANGLYVNGGTTSAYLSFFANSSAAMTILANGSVAIGTTDPKTYKLAVNGSAIATSMTVKLYADWPDYVFKPAYRLPSLTTVKTYIDKNKHLPDMPSEKEVKDNGINLGEIVKVQTKKIEELTLYLIEKDKEVKEQDARIASLEAAVAKLTTNSSSK